MKKILLIFCIMFLLTGCSNSVNFDFKDNIDMKINLSFTLNEYKAYSNRNSNPFSDDEEARSSIEAIRNDSEAFINGNNVLLNEKSFINNGNNYLAVYEYTYSYSTFSKNSILNSCFDFFGVEEDNDNVYVSLSGNSVCAPFKLSIKADNRMINNNSNNIQNNEYIWNIKEKDNNVYFAISKTPMNDMTINSLYIVYFILGLVIAFIAYIIKKRNK